MSPKFRQLGKKIRKMPKFWRILIGSLFIFGGILGFLPILGFWMIPLGLLIMSPDFVWARRGYVSLSMHLRRIRHKRERKKAKQEQHNFDPSANDNTEFKIESQDNNSATNNIDTTTKK